MIEPAKVISDHLAERYVARQMSPEEELEFEEYLLEHPEILDQVTVAQRIKLGLRTLRERGELTAAVKSRPVWLRPAWIAAAAGIAAVAFFATTQMGPGAGILLAGDRQSFSTSVRDRALLGEITLVRTRNSSSAPALDFPRSSGLLRLNVLVDRPDPGALYSAELRMEGAEAPTARVEDLRTSADDSLTIFVNAEGLGAGRYQLTISAAPADGAPATHEQFTFELRTARP